MGTTAEKLAYLEETKADIRAAMLSRNLDVPASLPFRQYGDLIRTLGKNPPPKIPLNDMTWEQISQISSAGIANEYFSVGDRKAITIKGTVGTKYIDGTFYVYIIGIDHNAEKEGAGITFGGFKTALNGGKDVCLVDDQVGTSSIEPYFKMSEYSNYGNDGGWRRAYTRNYILGGCRANETNASPEVLTDPSPDTLMAALPADLRAVMKPMGLYALSDYASASGAKVMQTTDYLGLLSEFEIFGSAVYSNSDEKTYQQQYQYYKDGNKPIMYRHNDTTQKANFWTRSAYKTGSFFHVYVGYSGDDPESKGGSATMSLGLAPFFRV